MGLRHRPIVEAEHGFDAAVQFVRQVDVSDPPAIRAARMLEPLQVDTERGVELSDRAREHHGAAPGVFLDDRKSVGGGKSLDRSDVRAVGAKLLLECLTGEMAACPIASGELRHPLPQRIGVVAAEKHANLEPLRGVGLADGLRPR